MNVIDFTIPALPKTPNSIGKASIWHSVNERKKWRGLVKGHFLFFYSRDALTKGIQLPFKRALLILTRCSSREPDVDNLYASFKYVIDGLKYNGIILDDKPSVIDLRCKWEKVKNKESRIKIHVEETQ
jgi:Holliday junction resolvase RusA-like endonuclease